MNRCKSILLAGLLGALAGCSDKNSSAEQLPPQKGSPDLTTPHSAQAEPVNAAISAAAAQKAGIEIESAGPARIRTTLTLYGFIKPNAEREQDIRARYPGVIRTVMKRTGDSIKKGDVLVTVESSESLQVYSIRAPLSGQVLSRSANPGDAIDSSTVLMKVADLSSLWAEFAVFARDLGHVRKGMTVLFRSPDAAEGGEAKLSYVAPAERSDSQSVVARAVIDNHEGRWVAGQFVTGDIVTADIQAGIAVQPAALQQINGKSTVFVQTEKGFSPREVEVGRRSREAVEITSGITSGARYASKNSYLIKADLIKGEGEED